MNSTINKFYVYGHYRKDTNTLFYVGKGCGKRAWSKRGRNKFWKRISDKHGYYVFIFYENISEKEAFNSEKSIILDLSPMANFSEGGVGGNTLIGKTSEEIKVIQIKKSKKMSGKNHPQYGLPKSTTTKNKIAKKFKHIAIKVICNETGETFSSISECARKLNIDKSNLQRLKKGNRKSLKGLTFTFIEPARNPSAWSGQYDQSLNY